MNNLLELTTPVSLTETKQSVTPHTLSYMEHSPVTMDVHIDIGARIQNFRMLKDA